ncbi:hypothetical protein GCG54_00005637 [Colletotrichum gloeosporioides]|uniref:Uncharacterized protein n=1 Tax=Colletotrichum gloeosporioides TaxID=474922 RepID=A0A8H4CKF8_COLGL|nr:uncharacterized protein GCG54_00005637 [Colletotrichum gloeosporioides]KAF3805598.1 hypothetical protein GCG54_00005637 [Colletotrichum gloeosporioides]
MSNLNWTKPEQAYRDGKRLTLYPYEPTRPHGSGEYHRNPLPRDLPYGHIRDFNTKADFTKTQVEIEIQEIIRRGVNRTSQIFRCSVIKAPEEERPAALQEPLPPSRDENGGVLPGQLAAKVFDYDYYESDFGGPWGNDEEADGNHCREHAVYAYYRRNGKTGYPHIMPQFYGSWVIKIHSGSDENNQPKFRYVGLILIEYIHGYSVENLCLRDRDGDYCSALYPSTLPVGFPNHDGSWLNVTFDVEKRQHVVKEMLHGVVVGMHLGVQHTECEPWNLFVTMRNGLVTLEKPRVVLLDHSYTEVWSLTKDAEAEGDTHCLQKLPYPPHPIERCSIEALDTLEGWWPPTQRQHPGFNEEKFDEWLCEENVFGPHVEAKSVLDPLLGQKKLWPHKYKKYSTFATLDLIEAKEKEVRGAVASKIIQFARENEDMNSDGRQEEREKAIAEGVRRRATFVMTSDSYSLWLRTKVRKLRETKERGLQEAKPREFRETQERERREAKQRKRQEAKARKRQEHQERRRQAEAQALSPPPQVSTSITRIDSSHHDPSRASTIHSATPAGAENRPPQTPGFNYETPDLFRLASARSGSGDEPPDLFRLSSTRPGSGDEPPDLLTRSSVPSVFRDTPPTWIVPHQPVPAP